jgi:hypothetical protein
MTWLQLDPSTQAPCTSSTLALGCPPLVPAAAAEAAPARPEAWTAARPASAAVPFNTARRVGMPISSLAFAVESHGSRKEHRLAVHGTRSRQCRPWCGPVAHTGRGRRSLATRARVGVSTHACASPAPWPVSPRSRFY